VGVVGLIEQYPGPWVVSGVERESILWAPLIHLSTLLPEFGAFAVIARVVF